MTMVKECTHHWCIEQNKSRYSVGVCKYCGVKETFDNVFNGTDYVASLKIKLEQYTKPGSSTKHNLTNMLEEL